MTALAIKAKIHNWVRPTFEQLDEFRKKDNEEVVEHVLAGGLMLEDKLVK